MNLSLSQPKSSQGLEMVGAEAKPEGGALLCKKRSGEGLASHWPCPPEESKPQMEEERDPQMEGARGTDWAQLQKEMKP